MAALLICGWLSLLLVQGVFVGCALLWHSRQGLVRAWLIDVQKIGQNLRCRVSIMYFTLPLYFPSVQRALALLWLVSFLWALVIKLMAFCLYGYAPLHEIIVCAFDHQGTAAASTSGSSVSSEEMVPLLEEGQHLPDSSFSFVPEGWILNQFDPERPLDVLGNSHVFKTSTLWAPYFRTLDLFARRSGLLFLFPGERTAFFTCVR